MTKLSRQQTRRARKTVLIVCEGKRDKAFLEYLRSLYTSGEALSPKVDVKQAKGKGGSNVVDTLLGTLKVKSYDIAIAFLENDVPPDARRMRSLLKVARGCKKLPVATDPCLEGLFLRMHCQPVPDASHDCKKQVDHLSRGLRLYCQADYNVFLPKEIVDAYAGSLEGGDDFSILLTIYKNRSR